MIEKTERRNMCGKRVTYLANDSHGELVQLLMAKTPLCISLVNVSSIAQCMYSWIFMIYIYLLSARCFRQQRVYRLVLRLCPRWSIVIPAGVAPPTATSFGKFEIWMSRRYLPWKYRSAVAFERILPHKCLVEWFSWPAPPLIRKETEEMKTNNKAILPLINIYMIF